MTCGGLRVSNTQLTQKKKVAKKKNDLKINKIEQMLDFFVFELNLEDCRDTIGSETFRAQPSASCLPLS